MPTSYFILTPDFCLLTSALTSYFLYFGAAVFENFEAFLDACVDAVRIKAILGEQQFCVAMSDEAVRDAHAHDSHLI